MKVKGIVNTAFCFVAAAFAIVLGGTKARAQGALTLVAEAVYANDSVNYTIADSTRYVYSGTRTSNMKTGEHLYDTASRWATIARIPYVRNMRTYDTANNVASHTTQLYKTAGWRNSQQFLYKYLSGAKYDTVWLNRWDTTNLVWETSRIYKYKYNINGKLDSIYWLRPSGSSWTTEAIDSYVYTDTFLTKHTLDVWNDTLTQWDRWQLETYHYDLAIGMVDTYERHTIDVPTIMLQPEHKEVYVYDGSKRVAGRWAYYWFTISQSWQGLNEYYYSYNSHDDVTEEVKNYWDLFAQMWGPLNKTYYYYDPSFNITDIIEKEFDYPIFKERRRKSWLYNSAGLPTVRRNFVWNDMWFAWLPEKSNNSQTLYYYEKYNGIANAPMQVDALLYPNPASNNINLRIGWRQQQPVSIYLHDMQGRLVCQWDKDAGGIYSLQLQGIQSGQYLLHATNGSEEMTKLLIIANQ